MIMLMIMLGQEDWDLFVGTSARRAWSSEHMSLCTLRQATYSSKRTFREPWGAFLSMDIMHIMKITIIWFNGAVYTYMHFSSSLHEIAVVHSSHHDWRKDIFFSKLLPAFCSPCIWTHQGAAQLISMILFKATSFSFNYICTPQWCR